ncbi:hypothetical protein C8J56DRAFT_1158896 [Mycena floridula]|nr:hypothetical protein C8J56DRAFT_1158896 [Mycena floridula]
MSPLPEERTGIISSLAYAPFRILIASVSYILALLQPFAPQIIPILICTLFIPIIALLSSAAGWIVWQNVAVAWRSPLYLQYGDGGPPYAYAELPKLASKQSYDIALHLTVPATESNYALGNFMTTVTLATAKNKTLASVRRAAIAIPPRNGFFNGPPSILAIAVPLWASYVPGTSYVYATVELGRKDGWRSLGNGQGRELSVLSAAIHGTVVHKGIRGLLTRFPLTFSVLASFLFGLILSAILGACVLPSMFRQTSQQLEKSVPLAGLDEVKAVSDSEEKMSKRRRRSKQSRSRSLVKKEEAEEPVDFETASSSTLADIPLRRRRSRLMDNLSDSDN